MANWTLNGVDVSSFGAVEYEIANQSAGSLTITRHIEADALAFWAYGVEVLLRDPAGVVRFRGKVLQPRKGRESARQRTQLIAVADGWKSLERKTWVQDYPFDTSTASVPRVLIGGHYERVDITDPLAESEGAFETVIDIVPDDLSISLGAALDFAGYGAGSREIGIGGIIPPQQSSGISIAGVIRRCCQYFPGSVAWVDPADGMIRILKPSAMPVATFDVTQCVDLDIREKPELVLPGARLNLSKVRQSNGGAQEDIYQYEAGNMAAEGAFESELVELLPEQHALQIAYFAIEALTYSSLTDINWWAARIPWIKTAQADTANWSIDALSAAPRVQSEDGILAYESLRHVITRGSVPEAFRIFGCYGPVPVREPFVSCGTLTNPNFKSGSATTKIYYKKKVGGAWIATSTEVSVPLYFSDLTVSGKYGWEDPLGFDPGESPEEFASIADNFYTEAQHLGIEGRIEILTDELPASLMGKALQLTGVAFPSLPAPIHKVRQNVHTRRTVVEFGAAEYLGLSDLIDLLRATNHRRPRRRRSTRFGLPPNPNPRSSGQAPAGDDKPPQPGETAQAVPADPEPPQPGPFEVVDAGDGTQVVVGRSTLQGAEPDGFDANGLMYISGGTSGALWAKCQIDANGDPTVTLAHGSSTPPDDPNNPAGGIKYQQIATWNREYDSSTGRDVYRCHNDCWGPIEFATCRRRNETPARWDIYVLSGGGGA
jgi:hypothetical protein